MDNKNCLTLEDITNCIKQNDDNWCELMRVISDAVEQENRHILAAYIRMGIEQDAMYGIKIN